MKILLVEDELDLGAIVQKSLSHHQYIVDWVVDGQAGWENLLETVRGFGYRFNF